MSDTVEASCSSHQVSPSRSVTAQLILNSNKNYPGCLEARLSLGNVPNCISVSGFEFIDPVASVGLLTAILVEVFGIYQRILSLGRCLEIRSCFCKVCLSVERSFVHHAAKFILGIISGTAISIALLIRL
jgi:hypothetical protein